MARLVKPSPRRFIDPGETCWRDVSVASSGFIVDACDYFRIFYHEAARAKQRILLAGWQFDSRVKLLRGKEGSNEPYPVELLAFLCALCKAKPELDVYILAWDYSPVFALEREWLQWAVFDLTTPSNLHFLFDDNHPPGGSHHQKIAVIDDAVAFSGGIDLARARWDDRRHLCTNPLRQEEHEPQKPYHDVMAYVTGEAARDIASLFAARWEAAGGEPIAPLAEPPLRNVEWEGAIPMAASRVGLCRTRGPCGSLEPCNEILTLYRRAVSEAERLIYIETQYFTARPFMEALIERLADTRRGPLDVVAMLPDGADTEKERLVLGAAQERTLRSVEEAARAGGSRVRLLTSAADGENPQCVATFIHSKVLIVDDRLACISSANLTNRSLLLDTELGVAWEAAEQEWELARSIARLRSELLGEHSGLGRNDELFRFDGLVDRLDELLAAGTTRLRARRSQPELLARPHALHLERLFDPEKPLTEIELEEVISWPSTSAQDGDSVATTRTAQS